MFLGGIPWFAHRAAGDQTNKINPEDFAVTEWRDKCKDFALSYIDKQMKSFKRLGVLDFGRTTTPP